MMLADRFTVARNPYVNRQAQLQAANWDVGKESGAPEMAEEGTWR